MILKPVLLFILLQTLFSCNSDSPRYPGICISFDDRAVRDWYSLRDLLDRYDAKVTFYVTQFDSLDTEEVRMLRELKEDGHEIGSHGALHVNARNYILKNGYNNYLSKEIDASILAMRTEKFEPTSFAYPFGAKFLLTDYLLLKKFNVLRGVADLRGKEDITSRPEIYYNFNHDRTLSALSIDQSSGLTKKMVRQGINRAKETKQVLLLYGHRPAENSDDPYVFDLEILKYILVEAQKNGLKFVRMSDLGN